MSNAANNDTTESNMATYTDFDGNSYNVKEHADGDRTVNGVYMSETQWICYAISIGLERN